ncbi:MAG TPA: hypothetical protein PLI45_02885 [Candidatus Woesebacteria bacterium]|nr:hypothetical protein [Candidatus Woesebacteria bacterium]
MEDKNNFSTIKNLVDTAKSIIVILPSDPGKDLITAATCLHLSLAESGKVSKLGCGSEVHLDSPIAGIAEIPDTIGSRNLIISFDYKEEDLDKVDYDVREDGKFYLLVKPKVNAPVPEVRDVKFSYSGANADLVITLGVSSLEELGKIYAEEKHFLDNANIISLSNSLKPAAFTGNSFHKNCGSFSELIASLLEIIELNTNIEVAQKLLNNIYDSTNNLTAGRLTADTFAAIAFLMRSGATVPREEIPAPRFSQPPFFDASETSSLPQVEENIPLPQEEDAPVPSDWSKPKIFRVNSKND